MPAHRPYFNKVCGRPQQCLGPGKLTLSGFGPYGMPQWFGRHIVSPITGLDRHHL